MREQASSPPAPSHEPAFRDRSPRDLVVALAVVLCGGALFVTFDAIERLAPAASRWESAELDDLLLTLCLAVAMAGWFSYRRWRDSLRRLAALRRSAEERAYYLRRLEELSSQLLEAEEAERVRLSEVLHDDIGQTLYACQLKLGLLERDVRGDGGRALLAEASELTALAMTRARDLSVQLSPPALADLGLAEALEAALPRMQQRYALTARLTPGEAWQRVPRRFYGPLFQSLEELVLNAAKHGGAATVTLSAEPDPEGGVRIVVADDGRGFDPGAQRAQGFGLFSIERRMACMNGALELRSAPGAGTVATLRLGAD